MAKRKGKVLWSTIAFIGKTCPKCEEPDNICVPIQVFDGPEADRYYRVHLDKEFCLDCDPEPREADALQSGAECGSIEGFSILTKAEQEAFVERLMDDVLDELNLDRISDFVERLEERLGDNLRKAALAHIKTNYKVCQIPSKYQKEAGVK